jgi:hypothetical protein
VVGHIEEKRPAWILLAGLVLVALLAAVSCSAAGEQRAEEPTGDEQASADVEHPSLGEAGAPVVMTEYADYQ